MSKQFAGILVGASWALSSISYSFLPNPMVTHWNSAGRPDGYSSKIVGVFLFPVIVSVLFILFRILPKLDPLHHNRENFSRHYSIFITVFLLFLLYMQTLVYIWNSGFSFSMSQAIVPAVSVLFFSIGVLLKQTKRNLFIGIRTPWTLSSDSNWEKTHAFASVLFQAASIVISVSLFFPQLSFIFVFCSILFASFISVGYSYLLYKKVIR